MPVIDRAFWELTSNAPDVEKGFSGLIRTMAGTNEAVIKLQQKMMDATNTDKALRESTIKLEEEQGKLSQKLDAGGLSLQKFTEYSNRLKEVNRELVDNDKKLVKSKEDVTAVQKQLSKATEESGSAFKAFGTIISDFATHPLQTAQRGIQSLLGSLGPTAVAIGALGAAAVAGGVALFEIAKGAADTAQQLKNLSSMSGLSTQELQALEEIGKHAGLESMNLGRTLAMLNRQMASGEGGDLVKTLNAMRFSAGEGAADISRGIIPVLDDFQKHLLAIGDAHQRAELQNKGLSMRLREMGVLLTNSNVPLSEQIRLMEKAGVAWSDATNRDLLGFKNMLNSYGIAWDIVKAKSQAAVGWLVSHQRLAPNIFGAGETSSTPLGTPASMSAHGGLAGRVPSISGNPLVDVEQAMARAKAIAAGDRENLELKIKLKQAEDSFADAVKSNDVAQANALANRIAGIKQELEERKKAREEEKKLNAVILKLDEEDLKRQESIALASIERFKKDALDVAEFTKEIKLGMKEFFHAQYLKDIGEETSPIMSIMNKNYDTNAWWPAVDLGLKHGAEKASTTNVWAPVYNDLSGGITDAVVSGFRGGMDSLKSIGQRLFGDMLKITLEMELKKTFGKMFNTGMAGAVGLGQSMGGGTITASDVSSGRADSIIGGGNVVAGKSFLGVGGTKGAMLQAGAMIGGSLLLGDAWTQGGVRGVLEGAAGGAMMGAAFGSAFGPLGTAIGAGVGAIAGAIMGAFGGGDKRRAKEAARRVSMQEAKMFSTPTEINRVEAFGSDESMESITSLAGRQIQYSTDFETRVLETINRNLLMGGSQLADNIEIRGGVVDDNRLAFDSTSP